MTMLAFGPEYWIMSQADIRPLEQVSSSPGEDLLLELQSAFEALVACLDELNEVLDKSPPDLRRLTTVRLKLAKLRLTRGPLLHSISTFLAGRITTPEAALLQQLRATHQRILEQALVHTGIWSLQAVEASWPEYRRATREVTRRWLSKAQVEQQLLYPLLRRHV